MWVPKILQCSQTPLFMRLLSSIIRSWALSFINADNHLFDRKANASVGAPVSLWGQNSQLLLDIW